jgi:glycosyltransferase involved in cell wall biosynthesis
MEGIARFNFEILKRIVKDHPEDEFYFFFDRPYSEKFIFAENVIPVVLFPPTRHPILMVLWQEFMVKKELKKIKPDVFFSGDTYMPLNPKVPTVLVSHDLAFLHFTDNVKFADKKYYNYFFPRFHNKADKLIAVSKFTKRDIEDKYRIASSKIDVVYNAANGHLKPTDEMTKQKVKEKLTEGNPYFVYLGSIHPRKNLVNLIKAFNVFKSNSENDYYLVIIGRPAWKTEEFYKALESSPFRDRIITKQVDRSELPEYIGSADALFYVSLFEGFGIPILEGFEAGIPVVTSNLSSMPEVADEAAILVDPRSPESIAGAMTDLALDPTLRDSLVKKGFERLKYFSWDVSAKKTYDIIKEVAK